MGPVAVGRVRGVSEVGDGRRGADFGVDKLGRYVAGAELAGLRHLGQGAGQVDEGVAAVGGGKEEEIQFYALSSGSGTRVLIRDMAIGFFGRDGR